MSPVDQDAIARERSLDPARSVLLQAPAGSGKTTVLIQRYLRLLGVVDSPEQILAITFTRKAAGEMMQRVLEALGDAPADARTAELAVQVRERSLRLGWQLETHPSRLRIQTIDALNHRLAAALPVAARAGASLQLADDPDELYRRAAGIALRSAESDPLLQRHSGLWFERLGNDWPRLQGLLAQMLARRGHWLRHISGESPDALATSISASLESLVRGQLEAAARTLPAALLEEGMAMLREARVCIAEAGRSMPSAHWAEAAALADELRAACSHLAVWRALATLALTADTASRTPLRKVVDARMGFAPKSALKARAVEWLGALAERPDCVEMLVAVRALPEPAFSADDAEALAALSALLQHAVAELALVFTAAGGVDHTAISGAARQALSHSNGSELAIHQGDQLRHILVDEFQDTSVEQYELIEGLIDQWQPGEQRSLFLVGDPMQSIYQFREAEVALFMRARDEGIAGWPLEFLSLTRNFRSQPAIVQFVNDCFAEIFPRLDDRRTGAVRYHPSEAATAKTAALSSAVHCWRFRVGDVEAEAECVLRIVQQARAANGAASIAVLVAARPHAVAIARTLRRQGIATRGVDLVPIMEMPVIQDLLALTRAVLSPADRIAWLAVLRAPWCGLELDALAGWLLREAPGSSIVDALQRFDASASMPAEAARRLTHLREVLQEGLARLQHAPLALVVESIWLRLGGPACYASSTVISDAEQFFVALRAEDDHDSIGGVGDLERLLGGLYAASEGDAADAVQIMTVHRAKGLEFDCVILPGLGRGAPPDADPLLQWLEWVQADGRVDLLLSPIRPAGQDADALSRWMRDVAAKRRRHERARVLYVAATRARSALHLLGAVPEPSAPDRTPAPRNGTALGTLWGAVAARFLAREPETSAPAASQEVAGAPAPQWLERLPADWRSPPPEPPFEWQGIRNTSIASVEAPEFRWAGEIARQVGVVVHRELQHLLSAAAPQLATDDALRVSRVRAWLEAEGVPATECDAAIARVVRAIGGTLGDDRGLWILDRAHRDGSSELALTGLYEGRLQNIVIDRSFIDADGRRWVIDFKTSEHLGGDRAGFIANELRRYRGQLQKYRALAAGLGPEPVHAALYFPMFGSFVELPPD